MEQRVISYSFVDSVEYRVADEGANIGRTSIIVV